MNRVASAPPIAAGDKRSYQDKVLPQGHVKKEKKKKFDLTIWIMVKLCAYLICSAMCFYQIYTLCDDYGKYEVVFTTEITFSDVITPPDPDICFNRLDMVDWDKYFNLSGKTKIDLGFQNWTNQQIIDHMLNLKRFERIKINQKIFSGLKYETIFQVLIGSDEIFKWCSIPKHETMRIGSYLCSDIYDIVPYLNMRSYCFALFSRQKIEYKKIEMKRMLLFDNFLLEIHFNHMIDKRLGEVRLSYNDHRIVERGGNKIYETLAGLKDKIFKVSYVEYDLESLKSPYQSNCIDYYEHFEESWVIDRGTCHDACMIREQNKDKRLKKSFPSITTFKSNLSQLVPYDEVTIWNGNKLYNLSRTLNLKCDMICSKPECSKKLYSPIYLSSENESVFGITTFIPKTPTFMLRASAKSNLLQTIINAMSSFGMWIGGSVIGLFLGFSDMLKMVKEKIQVEKKKKKGIRNQENNQEHNQEHNHDNQDFGEVDQDVQVDLDTHQNVHVVEIEQGDGAIGNEFEIEQDDKEEDEMQNIKRRIFRQRKKEKTRENVAK